MDERVDYEIRQGGMVVAAVSGHGAPAACDAMRYFVQYSMDNPDDELVELVQVITLASNNK